MASPALAMTPPPSPGAEPAPPPTSPPVAAPAAPQPSPALQSATQDIIKAVNIFRGVAQSYPGAAPHVQKINEEVRQIMRVVMEHQEQSQPAAPPIAG